MIYTEKLLKELRENEILKSNPEALEEVFKIVKEQEKPINLEEITSNGHPFFSEYRKTIGRYICKMADKAMEEDRIFKELRYLSQSEREVEKKILNTMIIYCAENERVRRDGLSKEEAVTPLF